MSFQDNSVFVAVPSLTDRFEPALWGGAITPDAVVGDLVELVALADRLVDTLELETRIWTRV